MIHQFFATCPRGLEQLLASELRELGASRIIPSRSGVHLSGSLALGYQVCLWSRLASRLLLPVARFPAASPEALYAGVRKIDWSRHLTVKGTLAVFCTAVRSPIEHTHFAALKTKDAVVDQFRAVSGERPSVDLECPDVRIHVHLDHDQASVSIDLAGQSLHRRGYRVSPVQAPLKENLAAAVLLRAGWPAVARAGAPLVDPVCGSGTLLIEAALMAADIAPGLLRQRFGFHGWRQHDPQLWQQVCQQAEIRRRTDWEALPLIAGYDADASAVKAARANCRQAGLVDWISLEQRELAGCQPPSPLPGMLVANPPYGERLGSEDSLVPLYRQLGALLSARFAGWKAAVLTTPRLGQHIGLRARLTNTLYNGDLKCTLLRFELDQKTLARERRWREQQATGKRKRQKSSSVRSRQGEHACSAETGIAETAQAGTRPAFSKHAAQPQERSGISPTGSAARAVPATGQAGRTGDRGTAGSAEGAGRCTHSARPVTSGDPDTAATGQAGGGASRRSTHRSGSRDPDRNGPPRGSAQSVRSPPAAHEAAPASAESETVDASAHMLANRLRKNLRIVGRWASRNGIDCYRLYDADLPEFNLAVDLYRGDDLWVHAQEYRPPASVDPELARQRRDAALATVAQVLELPRERVFYKLRQRQKGTDQYGRLAEAGAFHAVRERPCRFLVNFTDYLDTGLFLDHRPTRTLIAELAADRHFLNLFAYTATASVHAGVAGALSTTSVDLSATYLDWARRNLDLNELPRAAHKLVRADCVGWLGKQAKAQQQHWDLIFLDPPTFSNSKATASILDVQRDHVALIRQAASLLRPDGVLLFSTNYRRFHLDAAALKPLELEDITKRTVPRDFARRPRVHQCWRLET